MALLGWCGMLVYQSGKHSTFYPRQHVLLRYAHTTHVRVHARQREHAPSVARSPPSLSSRKHHCVCTLGGFVIAMGNRHHMIAALGRNNEASICNCIVITAGLGLLVSGEALHEVVTVCQDMVDTLALGLLHRGPQLWTYLLS